MVGGLLEEGSRETSVKIEVDVDLDVGLLEDLAERAATIPQWVGNYILTRARDGFAQGIDPDGFPWAPLAASTVESRIRRGRQGLRILVDTGEMLESLRVEEATDGVEVKIDGPAAYHQYGTSRMPRRRIFPIEGDTIDLPDDWAQDIDEFVEALLIRGERYSGPR